MDHKYCYPGTDVLINKFDIRDPSELMKRERQITTIKAGILSKKGFSDFSFDGLKAIHKYLFDEIYPFAGKIRDVDISKGNMFCRSIFIEDQAGFIFRKLQKDNYLKGLDKDTFISKLADYMADINALHPFREGNGRTQRIFFYALAKNSGYEINFSAMNKNELLQADIEAMRVNTSKLKDLLYNNCIDLCADLEKKIQVGHHTPEDIEKYNMLQAQRLCNSVESVKDNLKCLLDLDHEFNV